MNEQHRRSHLQFNLKSAENKIHVQKLCPHVVRARFFCTYHLYHGTLFVDYKYPCTRLFCTCSSAQTEYKHTHLQLFRATAVVSRCRRTITRAEQQSAISPYAPVCTCVLLCAHLCALFIDCPLSVPFIPPLTYTCTADQNVSSPASTQHSTLVF